jgi:NDP-sugar pyrophosphorylase family protein
MAILAGGLSTRLRPLTETIAKSMILVAGEPFIAHQLRMLAGQGIRDVVLLCGFQSQQIVNFVGNGAAFGCDVRYSFDGDVQRGTGGAIQRAMPLLGERFMVIYGDSYCPTDYRKIFDTFVASGKLGLMTIFPNQNRWDKSNVEFRNHRIVRYDKHHRTSEMQYIDYGINVFSTGAFAGYAADATFDLAAVQVDLVNREELAGYVVSERFYEIGSHSGLAETDKFLSGL